MFGSLAIGDGSTPNIFGFVAIISDLLFQPPGGSRATGSSIVVAGYGSKAIGVINNQDLRLEPSIISLNLKLRGRINQDLRLSFVHLYSARDFDMFTFDGG
jgi:hypothetical protein